MATEWWVRAWTIVEGFERADDYGPFDRFVAEAMLQSVSITGKTSGALTGVEAPPVPITRARIVNLEEHKAKPTSLATEKQAATWGFLRWRYEQPGFEP